jgi:DNA-binding LytR/AlgR family response regulator
MKLAICDDDPVQIKLLSSLVTKWAARSGFPVSVHTFGSAEAFQFAWSEDQSFEVLLLDIQMPGQNGMALARDIRKADERLEIIFITGFLDYISEGYEVAALHYLMKPVNEEKLYACLDKACQREKTEAKTLLVESGGAQVRIRQDEILYLEAFAHSVAIVAVASQLEVNEGIGALEKRLEPCLFVKPHRSYFVGLRYVRKIGKTALELDKGTVIPVSRRLYPDVNKAFIKFYKGER